MSFLLLTIVAALSAGNSRPAPRVEESLTGQEKQERAKTAVEKMREVRGQVEKLVKQARDEKDIVKLNCANERLAQVTGLLKISEQAATELRDALKRKEEDAADHAYAKVSIAGRKVAQLRQDAQQCIGQLAFYNDEKTLLEVDVPPGLPDDPTALPLPAALVYRPPAASGF